MRLRIGIDARLADYRRGMGTFVYYLLAALAEREVPHDFYAYVDHGEAADAVPKRPNFHPRLITPRFEPLWEQIRLPQHIRRDQLHIFHSTANTAPILTPARTAIVATIHDVMYLHSTKEVPLPRSRRQRLGRLYRRIVVPLVARRAQHIVTISEFSKSDIRRKLGVPENKISAILLAPAPHFRPAAGPVREPDRVRQLNIEHPYALALGATDPRKNTERIIRAFSIVQNSTASRRSLVIAGLRPREQEYFRRIARDAGILQSTTFLSFVDEATLVALYQGAEVFLYPSLYEGFGFPVVEAMACATPVITSNTTSIPELARGAAIMLDPLDTVALSNAMREVFEDPQRRADLARKGLEKSREFSWRKVAHQIVEIYERVGSASVHHDFRT